MNSLKIKLDNYLKLLANKSDYSTNQVEMISIKNYKSKGYMKT